MWLGATAQDRLLHLGNSLGHLDATRARLGAVEGGAAAPHTFFIVQDIEANLGTLIA
jgi:hypothetical protein